MRSRLRLSITIHIRTVVPSKHLGWSVTSGSPIDAAWEWQLKPQTLSKISVLMKSGYLPYSLALLAISWLDETFRRRLSTG